MPMFSILLSVSNFLQSGRSICFQYIFSWRADLGAVGMGGPEYIDHMVSRRGTAGGGPDPAVCAGPALPRASRTWAHAPMLQEGLPAMLAPHLVSDAEHSYADMAFLP